MSKDETFAVRINGGQEQHIIVGTGLYELAAMAAPALLMDEINGREPIMIEIWAVCFVGTDRHTSFHFLLAWDETGTPALRQCGRQSDGVWRPYSIPLPAGAEPPPAEWREPKNAKHGPALPHVTAT